jgi:hypothetical protein
MVNVAEVAPFGTTVEAGTDTRLLDEESETEAPPSGAAAESAIVAVTGAPPVATFVASVSAWSAAVAVTLTASVAVTDALE